MCQAKVRKREGLNTYHCWKVTVTMCSDHPTPHFQFPLRVCLSVQLRVHAWGGALVHVEA